MFYSIGSDILLKSQNIQHSRLRQESLRTISTTNQEILCCKLKFSKIILFEMVPYSLKTKTMKNHNLGYFYVVEC